MRTGGTLLETQQTPLIVSGATIEEQITFGQPLDVARFDRVVRACCLDEDIKTFPQLEQTVRPISGNRADVTSASANAAYRSRAVRVHVSASPEPSIASLTSSHSSASSSSAPADRVATRLALSIRRPARPFSSAPSSRSRALITAPSSSRQTLCTFSRASTASSTSASVAA